MKRKVNNNFIYKYICIYYGLSKYSQKIFRTCWGFSFFNGLDNKNIYNSIIDIEQFLKENFFNENFIKKIYINDVNFYKDLKNYKGFRFIFKLPVKGQRTKTNCQNSRLFKMPSIKIEDLNYKLKDLIYKEKN